MKVVQYARVSSEEQDADDKVSIVQQLSDMDALCERNGWETLGVFVDKEKYRATQSPSKGKVVNPSGERADRPRFLKMLEWVKTGDADVVLCWRDDRLVRHPRVAVALEDALDIGDVRRNGRPKIEIRDAMGAVIDRFTLSIKATIWREENKRRAERTKMGKIATLQQGRWPSSYNRYGYRTVKEQGKRGRTIVLEDTEAHWVRQMFEWVDAGESMGEIQRRLIRAQVPQRGLHPHDRKHDWSPAIVCRLLRSKDYTGQATYHFADGTEYTVEIPQIVPHKLWKRVQRQIDRNKVLSTRNAHDVYLLQGLLYCGDCELAMSVHKRRYTQYTKPDGTKKDYPFKTSQYTYMCMSPARYPNESHPKPYSRSGVGLDWAVWRRLVDYGLKQPNLVREYLDERRAALQAEADNAEGEIERVRRRLEQVEQERLAYSRQNARGVLSDEEYDQLMAETEERQTSLNLELEHLTTLRDETVQLEAWQDYMNQLFTQVREELDWVDCDRKKLYSLPKDERTRIMRRRREIVRALVEKVTVYADGRVEITGALDGSEAAQFELRYSAGWSAKC